MISSSRIPSTTHTNMHTHTTHLLRANECDDALVKGQEDENDLV